MRVAIAIGALVVALTIAAASAAFFFAGEEEKAKSPAPAPVPHTDVERVAAVIRSQSSAIAAGRGENACSHFSQQAREELQRLILARAPDYPFDCAFAMSAVAGRLPPAVLRALRHPKLTAVRVDGARANATVELPPELAALGRRLGFRIPIGKGVPLRRIDGRWKVDAVAL
ncbi:MAG: hypothetical protein ACR2J6_06690 [Thermoleophilaceae bacterium]